MPPTEAPIDSALAAASPAAADGASPNAAPSTKRRSVLARVWGFFWRGRELREASRVRAATQALASPDEQRARLLLAVGLRTQNPTEPFPDSSEPVAVELYRQATYFAVRALAAVRTGSREHDASPWNTVDGELLRIAGTEEAAQELVNLVESERSNAVWGMSPSAQAELAKRLRAVLDALLAELDLPRRARDALVMQRVTRFAALGLLMVVLAAVLSWQAASSEARRDVALGKAWRASSSYAPNVGCVSPTQQCAESPNFFFHTRDEPSPWVEIDLGKPTRFSSVRVVNRRDCCFERAVPLEIQASNRQEGFKQIARRTTSFSSWLAEFEPVEARYVRVLAPSRTTLHLSEVRVLR